MTVIRFYTDSADMGISLSSRLSFFYSQRSTHDTRIPSIQTEVLRKRQVMKYAETPEDDDIPTPEELFSNNYDMPELPEITSAKDILTAPPAEEDTDLAIVPQAGKLLTIVDPEDQEKNIDRAVRTLRSIAADPHARDADRISASKTLLESAGALGKGTVNIIKSDNTQINNNPEIGEHLINAFKNIGAVAGASHAKIRTHAGGKGI